jgi:hypothetical protein
MTPPDGNLNRDLAFRNGGDVLLPDQRLDHQDDGRALCVIIIGDNLPPSHVVRNDMQTPSSGGGCTCNFNI